MRDNMGNNTDYDVYYLVGQNIKKQRKLKKMTQLQLDSKEVLIIEDSPYGIRAAKATGALTLARTSGYLDGKQEEADHKIKSLDEIFKYIGEKTYAR